MKCLSVRQPWASMIACGKKTIETRTWKTSYRGDLLICSTKKPIIETLPLGVSLCVVDLYNCRDFVPGDEGRACCKWFPGYAWEIRNIRLVEPFEVRGKPAIFDLDCVLKWRHQA